MLWLDARDAFGQTLNAFDERAGRDGRTARRERFGRGSFRTRRTFGAFNARGWLR
jgi:hypothetical protein